MIAELVLVAALTTDISDPNTPMYSAKLAKIQQITDCRAAIYIYTVYIGIAYMIVDSLDNEHTEMIKEITLEANNLFSIDRKLKSTQLVLANEILHVVPKDVIIDSIVTRYVNKVDALHERLDSISEESIRDQSKFISQYKTTYNKCSHLLYE